jgi:hypothetical protein
VIHHIQEEEVVDVDNDRYTLFAYYPQFCM